MKSLKILSALILTATLFMQSIQAASTQSFKGFIIRNDTAVPLDFFVEAEGYARTPLKYFPFGTHGDTRQEATVTEIPVGEQRRFIFPAALKGKLGNLVIIDKNRRLAIPPGTDRVKLSFPLIQLSNLPISERDIVEIRAERKIPRYFHEHSFPTDELKFKVIQESAETKSRTDEKKTKASVQEESRAASARATSTADRPKEQTPAPGTKFGHTGAPGGL